MSFAAIHFIQWGCFFSLSFVACRPFASRVEIA